MKEVIYSTDIFNKEYTELQKLVPKVLSGKRVQELNSIVTCVAHGIFVFFQYSEKKFPINGFYEDLFTNNVRNLYILFHDCGRSLLKYYVKDRAPTGMAALGEFTEKEDISPVVFSSVSKNIANIELLRSYFSHAQLSENSMDQKDLQNSEKWFSQACGEKMPSTQKKWCKCNKRIVQAADEVYNVLYKRLSCFEKNHTEMQKELLLSKYYVACCQSLYQVSFRAVKHMYKKHRMSDGSIVIKAFFDENKGEIMDKTIQMLRKASQPIDPYKVFLQAIEIVFKY